MVVLRSLLDDNLNVLVKGMQKPEQSIHCEPTEFTSNEVGHIGLTYTQDIGGLVLG